jgi:hypothetical protein
MTCKQREELSTKCTKILSIPSFLDIFFFFFFFSLLQTSNYVQHEELGEKGQGLHLTTRLNRTTLPPVRRPTRQDSSTITPSGGSESFTAIAVLAAYFPTLLPTLTPFCEDPSPSSTESPLLLPPPPVPFSWYCSPLPRPIPSS